MTPREYQDIKRFPLTTKPGLNYNEQQVLDRHAYTQLQEAARLDLNAQERLCELSEKLGHKIDPGILAFVTAEQNLRKYGTFEAPKGELLAMIDTKGKTTEEVSVEATAAVNKHIEQQKLDLELSQKKLPAIAEKYTQRRNLVKLLWKTAAVSIWVLFWGLFALTYYVNNYMPHGPSYDNGDVVCRGENGPCAEATQEDLRNINIPDWAKLLRNDGWLIPEIVLGVIGAVVSDKSKKISES